MKAVEIAFAVLCIQIGLGIVTVSGLFPGINYESSITGISMPSNISASSVDEQTQGSIDVFNIVVDGLTWGWIKAFFQPFYAADAGVRTFIDGIIMFLDVISAFLIGIALFEFIRDRTNILG